MSLSPVSFHILLALADAPLHGYGLMLRLRDEGLRVGPGTIYGALSRMQETGWVREGRPEPARGPTGERVRYAVTAAGMRVLRAEAARVLRDADLVREHGRLGPDA